MDAEKIIDAVRTASALLQVAADLSVTVTALAAQIKETLADKDLSGLEAELEVLEERRRVLNVGFEQSLDAAEKA